MRNLLLLVFVIIISLSFRAQVGGLHTLQVMNVAHNARSIALATDFISVYDNDINIALSNPALFNEQMHKRLGFSQGLFAGGVNHGTLISAKKYKQGTLAGHIRYVNYGKMKRTEVNGIENGTFRPLETILGASYAKALNPRIRLGASLNLIYSQLEQYFALGSSVDFSGVYYNPESEFLATALVKNVGVQFKNYLQAVNAPLPVEFQMAVSKKLAHAPIRFSLLMHNINRWDLIYPEDLPEFTVDPLSGDTIINKAPGFGKKLMRHFSYQLELIPSKNFHLRAGFDLNRRQNLKVIERPGLSGFSFGVGLNFKRFSLDYGLAIYSAAGNQNMLTLTINLDKLKG